MKLKIQGTPSSSPAGAAAEKLAKALQSIADETPGDIPREYVNSGGDISEIVNLQQLRGILPSVDEASLKLSGDSVSLKMERSDWRDEGFLYVTFGDDGKVRTSRGRYTES